MSTQKRVLLLTLLVGSMLVFGMAHAVSAVAAPLPGPNAAPPLSPAGVQIVEHSPVTNAVGVDVDANISATFDESINGATVTTDTFAVHGRFSGIMTGNYVVTGSTIQVDPSRRLSYRRASERHRHLRHQEQSRRRADSAAVELHRRAGDAALRGRLRRHHRYVNRRRPERRLSQFGRLGRL